jgi:hypothetical protein
MNPLDDQKFFRGLFWILVGIAVAMVLLALSGCTIEDMRQHDCEIDQRRVQGYELCRADPACRMSAEEYRSYLYWQREMARNCVSHEVEK